MEKLWPLLGRTAERLRHSPLNTMPVRKRGGFEEVEKPKTVVDYNKYMSGRILTLKINNFNSLQSQSAEANLRTDLAVSRAVIVLRCLSQELSSN